MSYVRLKRENKKIKKVDIMKHGNEKCFQEKRKRKK